MDALSLKEDPDSKMEILTNVPQGGLVLVLIDSDTGVVIWAGVVAAEVQKKADAKTAKARLNYAVTKLIRRIPK